MVRVSGFVALFFAALVMTVLTPTSAKAATCDAATSAGTAPASWQSYCWLNLADYNDATARSGSGQSFSVDLTDGSTLNFVLRTSSTAATGAAARAAPSWTGAAVGNSAFLGIPGQPILYMANSGSTVTFTFSNISVTPPPGVATVSSYSFVVADAESTDNSEYLEYGTNGTGWQILDEVPPISGSQMPGFTGEGTTTFRNTGDGQSGRVGAYIAGTTNPTTVTAEMRGQGLQGMMFAVRFASISLTKTISGVRVDAADQFEFSIENTAGTTTFASGTTTGTGNGPFPAAVLSTASGIPLRLRESMATGSTSALTQYRSTLTCTNENTGSSTVMPNGEVTTDYDFGALQFGDTVACEFVNTPYPHVSLTKVLGAGGRIFDSDQFRLRVRDLDASTNVIVVVTTGTGSTFGIDSTGMVQLVPGTNYRVNESAQDSTDFARYTSSMVCTNANAGSATTLPTGTRRVTITPALGDVISCTVTNTREPADAVILVSKTSEVISDPIGVGGPFAIPGAIVEYTITVTNEGDVAVDVDTLKLVDVLPGNAAFRTVDLVVFEEGATPSGLGAFDAATMVTYSDQTGGAAPFDHPPESPEDGTVTAIQILPEGVLAASDGTNHPSFTIRYRMRIE